MGLILHCGSKVATLEEVRKVLVPVPERRHFPLPHGHLRDEVMKQLVDDGPYTCTDEVHALNHDGDQYFGLAQLSYVEASEEFDLFDDSSEGLSGERPYDIVVGWRGSYDQTLAAGVAMGKKVIVCDNLLFSGDVCFRRKNTRNIEAELPGIVHGAIETLDHLRGVQDYRYGLYTGTSIDNTQAHHLVIQAFRNKAIPCSHIKNVVAAWHSPEFEEFEPRTLWSLENAFSETMKTRGDVRSTWVRSRALYKTLDAFAGVQVHEEVK